MTTLTRRAAMAGSLAATGLAAAGCTNAVGSAGAATIDARVVSTMNLS